MRRAASSIIRNVVRESSFQAALCESRSPAPNWIVVNGALISCVIVWTNSRFI